MVREKGELFVVLDRNKPIAEIWPYRGIEANGPADVWEIREHDEKLNGPWSTDFELPKRRTSRRKRDDPID